MTCEMTAVGLCEGHDGFRYLQTTSQSRRLMAQVREAERFKCVRGETKERREELQTQTQVQVRETTGTPESLWKALKKSKNNLIVFITCLERHLKLHKVPENKHI